MAGYSSWQSSGLVIGRSPVRSLAVEAREFSSPEFTFCAGSCFGVCSTLVLPQQYVKDPGHSAKHTGGMLQLNTHAPSTQQSLSGLTVLSRHCVGTYQGNDVTRNWPGNARAQSSQLAEPL